MLAIHTAHVWTQILPALVSGPPDDSNEDSFVHYYLSPILSLIFGSDPLLKIKWANGQLKGGNENIKKLEPDFLVYNISGSIKCIVLIAEFKPTGQNSYVESDLVKLGKQMKDTMNKLVMSKANHPKVCGIHCEGEDIRTYIMDLSSPKLYRMIKVSKVQLFKNLDQISLLPNAVTHLLSLKEVASETASKIETAILYRINTLKRPDSLPPSDWLSYNYIDISRSPKKQKK